MANVIINDTNLTAIGNAIRSKNRSADTYLPSEMAAAIMNIPSDGVIIRVAELPNVVITVDSKSKTTDSTTGGILEFDSTTGTHTITASQNDTQIWTTTLTIEDKGVYYAKGRDINDLTWAEIHTTCQGGYADKMFNLLDEKTYVDRNSVFNNYKFYIQHFFKQQDGKVQIQWGMSSYFSGDGFNGWINSNTYTAVGGWKYSMLRRYFLPAGTEIISYAISLNSDTSASATGTRWSDYKYTDTKERAKFYDYIINDSTAPYTEQMVEINEYRATSQSNPVFVAGYFKSVGKIDETTFNNGYYYESGSREYHPATTYNSGTTYYGFYRTLQNDGSIYKALSNINEYLVTMELKQGCGNTKRAIQTCYDKVTIPSMGEIYGLYIYGTSFSSNIPSRFGDPIGCNERFDAFKDSRTWFSGNYVWTRSTDTGSSGQAIGLDALGQFNGNATANPHSVRPQFRTL